MTLAAQMNQHLSSFQIRELSHQDDELIVAFHQQHPAYYRRIQSHPVTAQEAVVDLDQLPGTARPDQKAYLGVFRDGELMAILDVLIDFPIANLVWIGLFMTADQLSDADRQVIYQALEVSLQDVGASQIQLGVLVGDTVARQFFDQEGFVELTVTTLTAGDRSAPVWLLKKDLF